MNKVSTSILTALIVLLLAGFGYSQNFVEHNTGNMQLGIIENGEIGNGSDVTTVGWTYGAFANVMYVGGFGIATPDTNVVGIFGSYDLTDFTNSGPISSVYSDGNFDQIADYSVAVTTIPGLMIYFTSYSNTGTDVVYLRAKVSNNTGGALTDYYFGLLLDPDVADYANNSGGYLPADNTIYFFENLATPTDPTYYGMSALNVPPNSISGMLIENYSQTPADMYNYMTSQEFVMPVDNQDIRAHLSTGPYTIPDGQVLTLDYAMFAGTDSTTMVSNAQSANQFGTLLPVELTSFTATQQGSEVTLEWRTATETNNLGFEVERSLNGGEWMPVGYKEGNGTTTEAQTYTFRDDISNLGSGSIAYRLKQVDFMGTFTYTDAVEVSSFATSYNLSQNYPNPFNPTTNINFSIVDMGHVTLTVYNSLGQEVSTLVNEVLEGGNYDVTFDASDLTSGVYYYTLKAGDFVSTKKLMLVK